jgi:parvulin-like peptidyl-prolyl isomerase
MFPMIIGDETSPFYVPTQKMWVDARHILIEVPEDVPPGDDNSYYDEALEVMEQLENGETFEALAATYSDDPGTASNGGNLGWYYTEGYVLDFREAVETAEVGVLVGPIRTQFGYHIVQVLGREFRDIEPDELETEQKEAMIRWQKSLRQDADITRDTDWEALLPQPSILEDFMEMALQ